MSPVGQLTLHVNHYAHTNREVAAVLVVSVHTVESALTGIYRKLGLRSRTELTRRISTGG